MLLGGVAISSWHLIFIPSQVCVDEFKCRHPSSSHISLSLLLPPSSFLLPHTTINHFTLCFFLLCRHISFTFAPKASSALFILTPQPHYIPIYSTSHALDIYYWGSLVTLHAYHAAPDFSFVLTPFLYSMAQVSFACTSCHFLKLRT